MDTLMQIDTFHHDGRVPVTVFLIKGDIDASSYEQLQAEAYKAVEAGTRNLVLDLNQVSYISSAGLRAIHAIRKMLPFDNDGKMKEGNFGVTFKSPHLKLLNPSQNVRRVLQMVGFDMFLEIHNELDDAIASF